ncbi:sugar ABC transporter permease [bacterium]|nr:sugar ABC transporter permease [bacterium]
MNRSRTFFRWQHKYAPYFFVAPFAVIFSVFGLYPLIKSAWLSFYMTSGPRSQVFVGLDNFRFLFSDADFGKAVWNTTVFAVFSVCFQLPLSLGLALLMNRRKLFGKNFFRLVFFSPRLVGMVFVAVLFSVIFLPQFGLLNRVLNFLIGLDVNTKWLSNARLVMPALVLTSLWMYVGFNMIYFLAALQAVDKNLYDAAKVDGASAFQQFVHVTLPGIKPVAIFVVVLSTIGSFQLFELPYLMLNQSGGPENAGLTVVMYLYQNGFEVGDLGYASAIGWTLAFGVLCISLSQMALTGAWKRGD